MIDRLDQFDFACESEAALGIALTLAGAETTEIRCFNSPESCSKANLEIDRTH